MSRLLASAVAVLLLAPGMTAQTPSASPLSGLQAVAEYPPQDRSIWNLEAYPVVTSIRFTNPERTRAAAAVTIGYSGATVELERENGIWVAKRLTNMWIT